MLKPYYVQTAAGIISGTTPGTLISYGIGSPLLAVPSMNPGDEIEVYIAGKVTDSGMANPTRTFLIKNGASVLTEITIPGLADADFIMRCRITCRQSGAVGLIASSGIFTWNAGNIISITNEASVATLGGIALDVVGDAGHADATIEAEQLTMQYCRRS